MEKTRCLDSEDLGFESHLFPLTAVQSWTDQLTSLFFSCLTFEAEKKKNI